MALSVAAEIQLDSEPTSLAFGNDRLFVGLENGQIKSLSSSLDDASSWPATGPVAALAAGGGAIFAAASGVRGWADSGQVFDLPPTASDVTSLFYYEDTLYVGDETGGVRLYTNGECKAEYNVLEEVKGLAVSGSVMFTARDIDVTFTSIKPEESRVRFLTQHTTEGRAPLVLSGDKLVFSSRCGRKLLVNSISHSEGFKKFSEVHASELILLALSADAESNDVWSSGWDGIVKRWKLGEDGKLTSAGELAVGACVNAVLALSGVVYVAVSGGRLLKINT